VAFVRVAFPVPVRQTFLYSVPEELVEAACPGVEVSCPFGRKERRGFVVERADHADVANVKPIAGVVGTAPVFTPELLRLSAWITDYYFAPLGRVLAGALPGGLEGFGRSRARAQARDDEGASATDSPAEAASAASRTATAAAASAPRVRLTAAQSEALEAIAGALDRRAYSGFLLHGVTGSGKTEVYLAAAAAAIARGRQVLVLVPEVALAHQIVAAFKARFGSQIGVLHSYLSTGERRANWERARRGLFTVVVGARSAVFAPLPDVGLVLIDEEHDAAYKQSEQIRYHGRDTALVRATLANAVAVLGTATPSLESWANVERGKLTRLSLPERVDGRPLPTVEIVDLNETRREAKGVADGAAGAGGGGGAAAARAKTSPLFSAPLLDALAAGRSRGEQALVFLNRRGHARVVECEDCGYVARCPRCDVALTYHSADERFRCHYCEFESAASGACPDCGSPFFRHKGSGTQRAERELKAHLPGVRVLRLDSDAARPRGAQASILAAFGRGEADVLLGTQMIAKGLDFHGVTLVGVLSADGSLHLPDFRAAERTFQTLVQVAGRAGRGKRPGHVIVQTRAPDHPSLTAAAAHDFAAFAARELSFRRDLGYPPFGRLVSLNLSGPDEQRVVDAASRVATLVLEARDRRAEVTPSTLAPEVPDERAALEVLGPAPSPMPRLRGRHRWRVTLKDRDTKRLHAVTRGALEALESATGRLPAGVLLAVDVDPYDVL
jgi:primosomal protein N' (replication factor Y)